MPRHVAVSHTIVITAPATYGYASSSAPAAVPESRVAANHMVSGKWQGQMRNAPMIHAIPLFSTCSGVALTAQQAPLFAIWVFFAMLYAHYPLRAALGTSMISMGSASLLGIAVWHVCQRWPWPLRLDSGISGILASGRNKEARPAQELAELSGFPLVSGCPRSRRLTWSRTLWPVRSCHWPAALGGATGEKAWRRTT